ncbi:RNA binding,RNA binding isoform 2 [Hibiscus syriacus]|uniref:RNA binding,RNA binding isoform 2 n=1 Tax=Hibiscus syriacus TaxID=106335 RepID=A0A6A2XVS1_HIBSY|nr:RNA binding,RNA binding isoform 2 [Hibiscus syriacus]
MAGSSKKFQKQKPDLGKPKFNKESKKQFKTRKDSNGAVKYEAVALQLEDDVPDFPREDLALNKNKRKKPQKKSQVMLDDLGSLFGDGITGNLPRYANKITMKNISPGMKLWGVVAEVNEKDLVIGLPGDFLKNMFYPGQLVSFIVLQLDDDKKETGKRKIWLSLRLSLLHKGFTTDDHGYILHFGLSSFMGFLSKDDHAGSKDIEVGLCHVSELSDDHIENIQTKYAAGEKVKAKILKLDGQKHRISLGMKNSYFTDDIGITEQGDSDDDIEETDVTDDEARSIQLTDSTPGMNIEYESGASSVLSQAESRASIPPLEVTIDDIEHADMDISQNQANNDDAISIDKKSKKRGKKKTKEERSFVTLILFWEREIRAAEERQLEKDVPRTADEFEKLVRNSPNSSFVWNKYMAFMLNSADIEKGRAIAERKLCKRYFKEHCSIVQTLLTQQQDGIQPVVNRALLCLPRHKHIKFISQAAILEFKSGVPDRGRSMLEGILREYPKRTDLWSIYLDQEIRLGDEDVIHALFERAISLKLPPKKMKFLLTKYRNYKESRGDEERVKSILQKTIDYVNSI